MKLQSKREKNYAYNINSANKQGYKNISFKMLTGNFYEDLINSDVDLQKNRLLNFQFQKKIYCIPVYYLLNSLS